MQYKCKLVVILSVHYVIKQVSHNFISYFVYFVMLCSLNTSVPVCDKYMNLEDSNKF